jgi:hypothetical protein
MAAKKGPSVLSCTRSLPHAQHLQEPHERRDDDRRLGLRFPFRVEQRLGARQRRRRRLQALQERLEIGVCSTQAGARCPVLTAKKGQACKALQERLGESASAARRHAHVRVRTTRIRARRQCIAEANRAQFAPICMQIRIFRSYLMADNRTFSSAMVDAWCCLSGADARDRAGGLSMEVLWKRFRVQGFRATLNPSGSQAGRAH